MRGISSTVFLLVFILPAQFLSAAEPTLSPEERLLREQGVATDGPGLLAFLRAQIPSSAEQARLSAAVGQLGHRSFAVRERASKALIAAGRPSLPLLRPAVGDNDLEVSRRAQRAIDDIERVGYPALLSSAIRVLAERRPSGAVEALFAYLPFAPDESVEEATRETLAVVGLEKGQAVPAVQAALSDRDARLRAAAVFVVGRSSTPACKELLPLLRDPAPEVRLQAAEAVLRGRDRVGIPVLLTMLDEAPASVGRRAEEVLFQLAAETAPSVSLGVADTASRKRCREAWSAWWNVQGDKVDLARLHVAGAPLGLTLYALYDSVTGDGRVLLTTADGKTRWEIDGLQGPNDARLLPGGRVLIAERNVGRVTERDTTGRILWEKRVEAGALSAQRLPGGNTLIASWTQVLEVTPAGKTVWENTQPAGFRHAAYQKNGRILAITAAGQLLELDRTGKLLRSVTPEQHAGGATYWASAEQSSNGHYLAALGSSRRVVELDEAGKVVWEVEAPNAVFATRLANGNTLVCCFEECQVVELDREGKEVMRRKLAGRPFTARRY
jgi:hypothetical protein